MAAGFRKPGLFMPLTLIPEEMKLDQGQIEVFNTPRIPAAFGRCGAIEEGSWHLR